MLAGLFLGLRHGLISTILFLALGALGVPVFAGGNAGLAVFFGPSGGFLFGYPLMAASIGFITSKMKPTIVAHLFALIVGNMLLYSLGVPWLKFQLNMSWSAALAAGLTPFIAGAVIKIAVACALGRALLPRFKQNLISASVQHAEIENE